MKDKSSRRVLRLQPSSNELKMNASIQTFKSYHDNAANYRRQKANFDTAYTMLNEYANEGENAETMDQATLFSRVPADKQEVILDLINPANVQDKRLCASRKQVGKKRMKKTNASRQLPPANPTIFNRHLNASVGKKKGWKTECILNAGCHGKEALNSGYREFETISFEIAARGDNRDTAIATLEDLADIFYGEDNLADYYEGPDPGTIETNLFESYDGYAVQFVFYAVDEADAEAITQQVEEIVEYMEGVQIVDILNSNKKQPASRMKNKSLNSGLYSNDTLRFTVTAPTTDVAWATEILEDIADSFYYDDYLNAFFDGPQPGTVETYLSQNSQGCTVDFVFSSVRIDENAEEIEYRVNDILSNYQVQVEGPDMY